MIALISSFDIVFVCYLFGCRDKGNIDVKVYHNYFTKISHNNPPIIKMILNADFTHHSYSILT